MGRKRSASERWTSRIIDIDILFYNNIIVDDKDLKIPHPLMHKRMFTMKPLDEIASRVYHPALKKTVNELMCNCEDDSEVIKVESNVSLMA